MKLPTLLALLVLTSAFDSNAVHRADRLELDPKAIPRVFSLSKKPALSATFSETDCKAFLLKKSGQRVGMVCASSNKEFLTDFGVSSEVGNGDVFAGAPESNRQLQIATGSSMYPMGSTVLNGLTVYAADVDCDERNEANYKPTATCQVMVALLGQGRFLYSNFVIEDNVTHTPRARKADIIRLWNHLTLSYKHRAAGS